MKRIAWLLLTYGLLGLGPLGLGCGGSSPAGGCGDPLDQETLDDLRFDTFEDSVQMQPGESRQFGLGVVQCCVFIVPVDACTTWSVDPTAGAAIDATGRLTIDSTVAGGTVYTVSANVEAGRRVLTIDVHVYTAESNPLVGTYREAGQIDCGMGLRVPERSIQELVFRADGTFAVTWMPFEVYRDYWGTYTFDLATSAITLAVAGGNYVPMDIDPSGTFSFDVNGDLLLQDMWLGTPAAGVMPPGCGHRFEP